MFIKFDVFFERDLGVIYKDNSIIVHGKEAKVALDLDNVHNISATFNVNGKSYTDLVEIVDIENKLVRIPFKTDVIKKGSHKLELKAIMKDGEALPSQTYIYTIAESLENPNSIEAETNYPILIKLLQEVGDKMDDMNKAIAKVDDSVEEMKSSIYDAIINEAPIQEVKLETMQETLFLCPSSISLAGAEIELVSLLSRENRLKYAISEVQDDYDYIFIDCPPSLGLLTLNALTAADTVLVPIQCEYFALEGLSQLMDTVRLVQKHLNKSLKVEGVVLTMFDARTNLSIEVADEVRRHFTNKVYQTLIPRNVRLSEAPSYGLPIILYDKSSKGAEAYLQLADELINMS